ncbi:MAG TPA: DUF3501 family protein [Polyangiaceae bacterium]|nr:DUF3501 family protein [Polyangiaceae bacterium]
MRKVTRAEIVDYQTYNDQRDAIRQEVLEIKRQRRVLVGDCLNFLFETTDTIRYQIQEMMRAEKIVRENDIQHEIDTYNELLGAERELGCTLLIEIDDPALRVQRLRDWLSLPEHLYVKTSDGGKVRPRYDRAQVGEDRLSSVQYLIFRVPSGEPVAVGADHPALTVEEPLTDEQRRALSADLASDG